MVQVLSAEYPQDCYCGCTPEACMGGAGGHELAPQPLADQAEARPRLDLRAGARAPTRLFGFSFRPLGMQPNVSPCASGL
jgi:hypothetical protein